jgi:hypothetical protein
MKQHDPVGEGERFPLRASFVDALKAQVEMHGATKVAAHIGTSAVHVDYYAAGGVPGVTDRQRVITWLLRTGAVQLAPGEDFFAPDGSEDPAAVKRWRRRYGPPGAR